jgi:hypothetical protein
MNDSADHRVAELDARDNRRWLIGVGISVAFGLFGVVMALLSYSHHRASAPPAAANTPTAHRGAANTPAAPAPAAESEDRERKPRSRHK